MDALIVSKVGLKPDTLSGETVIVTGAGGGIGYESARSLLWLGANVVIAEIDEASGRQAEETLAAEFDQARVAFIPTDVGDETSLQRLYQGSIKHF